MKHTKPEPAAESLFASDQAAADALARVGEIDRALLKIEERKARLTAKVQVAAENQATPLQDERKGLVEQLAAYCGSHRARLTDGGRRKFAPFPTGLCKWAMGRDRVLFDESKKDQLFEWLKKRDLQRFIRVKEELDRIAAGRELAEKKSLLARAPGLALERATELFKVEPTSAELTERP